MAEKRELDDIAAELEALGDMLHTLCAAIDGGTLSQQTLYGTVFALAHYAERIASDVGELG